MVWGDSLEAICSERLSRDTFRREPHLTSFASQPSVWIRGFENLHAELGYYSHLQMQLQRHLGIA
jgi:hypothetical protein